MGDPTEFFNDPSEGDFGPAPGANPLDPLDLRKSGAQEAARESAALQSQAAQAGITEQRRQFDLTTGRLAPFFQVGLEQLPEILKGSTAGGLDERLKAIMSGDSFKSLVAERGQAVGNGLAQGGLTRSGAALREAAKIPTDLALALEESLFGRQQSILGSGQNAAAGLGAFGQNNANAVTELLKRSGDAWAQNSLAQAQIAAQRSQGAVQAGVGIASLFFSDPRLKMNMEPIGKIGPLTLYEWDWIPSVSEAVGRMSIGFNADEVEQHFPQHVFKAFGFKAIDYVALTDELKERLQ